MNEEIPTELYGNTNERAGMGKNRARENILKFGEFAEQCALSPRGPWIIGAQLYVCTCEFAEHFSEKNRPKKSQTNTTRKVL